MTLRPYQQKAVDDALHALARSGSAALQMPTGAGKTKAATAIIQKANKPVWFVCHRQEIERQASRAFSAAGIDHGIVSPRADHDYSKTVQIVSVATLARRIRDMPLPFLVIWDECHHVAAKSWAAIRETLADCQHLGLTATPERLDGKGLAEWFNELIVGPTTRELIDGGWLSDFRYFAPSEPDLTGARMQAGDYAKKDLARVMNMPVLIGDAIAEYQKNAFGKRALVFCASVEASQELVARFNADGVPARHVDGTTATAERDAAVAALAGGTIKVLSNVEVFTEGFDLPAIDAVILMRPTKSLALFLQMIGRALRKAEGKDEALIFDHAGLWLDHDWFGLPISWSLEGGARRRRLADRTRGPRRCPECKEVRPVREPVCACGYEFPTGREIGEYDGVLHEATSKGLSMKNFGRAIGVSKPTVAAMLKSGMPRNQLGGIDYEEARSWLWENWRSPNSPPMNVPDPENYTSQLAFSKLVNVTSQAVWSWVRDGILPCADNGWPRIDDGIKWVEARRGSIANDRISRVEFAKRVGIQSALVGRLIRKGLPADNHQRIVLKDGLKWLAEYNSPYLPPFTEKDKSAFEPVKFFGERVGLARKFFIAYDWKKRGLPCASNGWVHIQRGLEWVRDNTDIEIPPEAWPTANDNAASAQAEAA